MNLSRRVRISVLVVALFALTGCEAAKNWRVDSQSFKRNYYCGGAEGRGGICTDNHR